MPFYQLQGWSGDTSGGADWVEVTPDHHDKQNTPTAPYHHNQVYPPSLPTKFIHLVYPPSLPTMFYLMIFYLQLVAT